jgi:hypothetical protein
MAHDHVRLDAPRVEQPRERGVNGEHRRLRDRGLTEGILGRRERDVVGSVHEDALGEPPAGQRLQHGIRLVERLRHNGVRGAQVTQHVDVLRALAGEQERDLAGNAAAQEHALVAERAPAAGITVLQCRRGLLAQFRQLSGIAVVDGDANAGPQLTSERRGALGRAAVRGPGLHFAQPRAQLVLALGTQYQRPAQRCPQ